MLSDSYLSISLPDETLDYQFADNECSGTIKATSNKVNFDVYSTLYDKLTLIGSYVYNLTDIKCTYANNKVNVSGCCGDLYKKVTEGTINLTLYDLNEEVLKTIQTKIDLTNDIDYSANVVENAKYYSVIVLGSTGVEIYNSGITKLGNDTNISFGAQRLTNDSLRFKADGFNDESKGYILDMNNNEIPISFENDEVVIPLFDSSNNLITYNEYKVYIDDKEYLLDVNTKELYVNSINVVSINNEVYINYDNYVSLIKDPAKMMLEIKAADGTLLATSSITLTSGFKLSNIIKDLPNTLNIDCYLTNDNDVKLTDAYRLDGVLYDRADLNLSVTSDVMNLDAYNTNNDYTYKYDIYGANDSLIASNNLDFTYTQNQANLNIDLDTEDKKINYQIYYKNILIVSKDVDLLKGNILDKVIDGKYLVLTTNMFDMVNGYMLNEQDEHIDMKIIDSQIYIPIYGEYDQKIIYKDHTIYLENNYTANTLAYTVEDNVVISGIAYENSYSANQLISFDSCITTDKSYSIILELWENNQMIESNEFDDLFLRKSYGCQNITNSFDTIIRIYAKETNGNQFGEVFETTLPVDAMNSDNFNYSPINPGEVLITYNSDKTINLYFDVKYSRVNPLYKLEIELTNSEDDLVYTYDNDIDIVSIENIENKAYGVTYTVYRMYDNLKRIYETVTPSGMINEVSAPSLLGIKVEENGISYITIDVSDYALTYLDDDKVDNISFDASKCYVIDHDNLEYDTQTHTFKVLVDASEESVEFVLYYGGSEVNNSFNRLITLDSNFKPKGEFGTFYQITTAY